jgi:hypothetical protein
MEEVIAPALGLRFSSSGLVMTITLRTTRGRVS